MTAAGSDPAIYVSTVILLYVDLPDTPLSATLQDHAQARRLHGVQLGDIHINHGNSGGPVFRLSDGGIIGIADAFRGAPLESSQGEVQQYSYNSGLGIIVPIKEAIDLISSLKITKH